MNDNTNPQSDLIATADAVAERAESNRWGDRSSAKSASYVITSNGRLERKLSELITTTEKSAAATDRSSRNLVLLTQHLLAFTVVLVALTVILVVVTIALLAKS